MSVLSTDVVVCKVCKCLVIDSLMHVERASIEKVFRRLTGCRLAEEKKADDVTEDEN